MFEENDMTLMKIAGSLVLAMGLVTVSAHAQESHEDAKAQVDAHQARHHTKAKFVGGGAVGGALVGAKVGGPVGALVGAGVGAGGGVVAHHIEKKHAIRKKEENGTPYQR
jgi:hypothetical protein